jgi:Protein of unknown function DUF262/Protein of unknown function (DUF1524)
MPAAPQPLMTRIVTVEDLFLLGAFVPAAVQRDYQWRSPQCRTLLADLDRTFLSSSLAVRDAADVIETATQTPEDEGERLDPELSSSAAAAATATLDHYMLGAIVVTPADAGKQAVYDGLQRLTTLTVMMAVLRDLTTDAELRDRLDALIRHPVSGLYRVTLAGKDVTLARQIQPRGESIKIRRGAVPSDMGKRIRIAAQVFREQIKPWDSARRSAFTRFLLERVHVDIQEARDTRLARQMFVTTNMRGKSLNRVDLLKGQLVDIADNDATATAVVAHWNGARNAMGDDFEALLVAVDFLERQAPQGDDCLNALADFVLEKRGPKGIEAWVQRLTMFAGDLLELNALMQVPPTDAFTSNIWRLQLFRWDNWRPLALLWFADYRRAKKQGGPGAAKKIEAAHRRFSALHKRCMGITLCSFSAADRERIFGRAIAQASRGDNPLSSTGALAFNQLQIHRIAETLRVPITDQETRSSLIRWFESLQHGDIVPTSVREVTVEHILPRRPSAGSDWIAAFPDVDARYLACNTLGNLAALDRVRNERLKNAEFAEKLKVFTDAAPDFASLSDIQQHSVWSAQAIAARTERMASQIEAALDLPEAYVKT